MTGNPRNAMVCATPYLQNEFGDHRFFYVFNLILSFSTGSQSLKRSVRGKFLIANVLKYGKYCWHSLTPTVPALLQNKISLSNKRILEVSVLFCAMNHSLDK